MAYATSQDISDLHGAAFLKQIADRDGNGSFDIAAVDSALALATGEINARLSVRYTTPVSPVPEIVKTACVEIAVYRLANNGNAWTEDIRKRYEDMIALLKEIATGKANLGLPALDTGAEEGDEDFRAPTAMWGRSYRGG